MRLKTFTAAATVLALALGLGHILANEVHGRAAVEAAFVSPQHLADTLAAKSGPKPMLIHVGFELLYREAHIPGSIYAGPGREARGLARLEAALKGVPKDRPILLYCGCCPWSHCPNVVPAFDRIHALGYKNVQVLKMPHDFGTDWLDAGYPTVQGR